MPKKRKTRKQKVNADSRHQEVYVPIKPQIESIKKTENDYKSSVAIVEAVARTPQLNYSNDYAYLYPDLRKIAILIFFIIVIQAVAALIIL